MEKKKLSQICLINPPKEIDLPEYQELTFLPMGNISVDGQVNTSKTISVTKVGNYSVFKNGDVLFAKITPCMENGKGCIAKNLWNGYGVGSTELVVLRPNNELVLAEWLYYFLAQKQFRIQCQPHMTGSAGQKRVPPKYLGMCEIPVPTIDEQKTIVARIEELFSQLDSGMKTLKTIKRQLEVYRQAVLKDVFQNVKVKRPIREMSSIVTSGSRGWAQYYSDTGARFIRITDLTRDRICLKNDSIQYVKLPENVEGKRSRLNGGDVLVSITADLGSIALVSEAIEEAYINQHIAMIRFYNPVQGEYMAWYLKSDFGQKDLLKNKRGGGKLGLGLDDIRDTPVPVVSDNVAAETVAYIDSKMSVCDSIEKTVDTALQQAEAMRQSILKQAFEGRL